MKPVVILSLETATLGGSVYLGRGETQLAARRGDPKLSHSNSLLSDINDSLREAGLTLPEVNLFACASGPGSFTGLRIGIATLKALAATLNRVCVGIPTLEAIAHAAGPSGATVALLPAGRGEVFAQMFSVSPDGEVEALDPAAHLSPSGLLERYGTIRDLTWAGSDAVLQKGLLRDQARSQSFPLLELSGEMPASPGAAGWRLVTIEVNLAKHVAALAFRSFERGNALHANSLSAIYVRPSDAELKEQCR